MKQNNNSNLNTQKTFNKNSNDSQFNSYQNNLNKNNSNASLNKKNQYSRKSYRHNSYGGGMINWMNNYGRPINETDQQGLDNNPNPLNVNSSNESNNNGRLPNIFKMSGNGLFNPTLKSKIIFVGIGILSFLLIAIIFVVISSSVSVTVYADESTGFINRSAPNTTYKCVTQNSGTAEDMILGKQTPYTRSEFIEKVNAYQPSGNKVCTTQQVRKAYSKLADKAGEIYDVATGLNLNPEIIFLRAEAEGYVPGCIPSLEYKNNFYGMGCGNGEELVKCAGFSTVMDGVYNDNLNNSFFKWIVRNTVGSTNYSYVFGIYAWLNDEWVNDDVAYYTDKDVVCSDEGLGACCYSRVVEEQLVKLGRSDRAEVIKSSCEGNTGVIRTLRNMPPENYRMYWYEESNLDQRAYSLYQTKTILSIRKRIFDLGPDTISSTESPNQCPERIITLNIDDAIKNRVNFEKQEKTALAVTLKENGSSIEDINKQLLDQIKQSGVGTRKAVVNAAKFQINALAQYNKKVTYMYRGGHDTFYDKSGKLIAKDTDNFYGINPYYGVELGSPTQNENGDWFYYLGLDCSGSANWALHNGGLNVPRMSSKEYIENASNNHITLTSYNDFSQPAQPGDLLVKYGNYPDKNGKMKLHHHVALIVDVDIENEIYTIIDESEGLMANRLSIKDNSEYLSKFKVAHLDYYYENAPKYSNFDQVFNDGLIKWEG
ncbi:MAG: hypothetical protein J5634_00910 [Bacilli bacterium]|nr:hypothetical protein [Bacilli bacterium]